MKNWEKTGISGGPSISGGGVGDRLNQPRGTPTQELKETILRVRQLSTDNMALVRQVEERLFGALQQAVENPGASFSPEPVDDGVIPEFRDRLTSCQVTQERMLQSLQSILHRLGE